ncbi:hypothetical protein K458DRAFT_416645 [Lentithecium fluviatile CBS 122367]|uniref:AA1-like domain-containing protein n=1 Tax=Lentithecium fluviatile CBS 122367 TaxID=1168545 RepID=A0A6G1J802_9PLEO|nr:hypothetical protein K458DRAFT_416645 [Lentithecium fluviatile CBS 122367]
MAPITTTLITLVLALTPLALAKQITFYIGYNNGDKMTWEQGQDTCMNEFSLLAAGPGQDHAVPCDIAFKTKDGNGNEVKLAYTKCGLTPPEVWEVDRESGAPLRQVGTCHDGADDTGKQSVDDCSMFWDSTAYDTTTEWTCPIEV